MKKPASLRIPNLKGWASGTLLASAAMALVSCAPTQYRPNYPVGYQNQGFQQPLNNRVVNPQQPWAGNVRTSNPYRQTATTGVRTNPGQVAPVAGPSYAGNYPYANGMAPQVNRPVVSAPAPSNTASAAYRVQSGDSLSVIGQRYGVSVDSLRRLNNIQGDLIVPGQNLRLR